MKPDDSVVRNENDEPTPHAKDLAGTSQPRPCGGRGKEGLLDLGMDPNDFPAELMKQGSDWFAVFNPNVGEFSLDGLVLGF